jgi:N-acetylglutamate synthase-like GNAT family acetyltransferase
VIIRTATEADIIRVIEHVREYHDFYADELLPASPNKVLDQLYQTVVAGRVFLAEEGEEIIGSLGCMVTHLWFSDQAHLCDMWLWVRPSKRASRAAVALVEYYKQYADDMGLPAYMEQISGYQPERLEKFYARRGFRRVGGIYFRPGGM